MPKSSVIKIPGGKTYLAPWIISLMAKHLHYVETHYGGGAVMLAKDFLGVSEVANDANPALMSFWACLKDEQLFAKFVRRMQAQPFSQKDWTQIKNRPWPTDQLESAVAYFILVRQSRQGLRNDFATVTRNRTRQGMNEQVSAWLSSVAGLPEVHSRLQRVLLLNQDANKCIKSQDGPQTLFYCDPPYLHVDDDGQPIRQTTKDYGEYEMTPEQHQTLLETLAGIEGKFLLSGYPSKMYDKFAKSEKWKREEKLIPNQASSKKVKDLEREVIWKNF